MDEKQLKEAIAQLMKEGKREAFAELMIEYVQPHHLSVDFVSLLLNARSLKKGDALVKKVRTGIKVHTLVPGAIHMAHEITVRDRINYQIDGADVKVHANAWELENGDIGTVDSIKSEMEAKLRDYYLSKVFLALSSIWSAVNTPNNFTSVGGVITSTALEDAIDYVNETTGGVRAVVGTRAALTPVTKFGAFWQDPDSTYHPVPSRIEEVMANGWLGSYYGAPLLALRQEYDNPEDYTALIPNDKVLVIGENVGEFISYGDVMTKEWTDMRPTPPQWYFEMYQEFGMIVDKADGIYLIGGLS